MVDKLEFNPRWIVAQEGSRQSYAVPISFHRLGCLRLFYVDVWCRWGRSVLRNGTAGTRALATHYTREIPAGCVVSFNRWALLDRVRYHFSRGRLSPAQQFDRYCRFGEFFANAVRNRLKKLELEPDRDHFFGFNSNCLEVLEHLRQRGVFTVVDQVDPGKFEEDMVLEEAERWPGWARTPERIPQCYWDRLKAEWEMADLVLVNSTWSADGLTRQGLSRDKIIVVPLAMDLDEDRVSEPIVAQGRLQVLWLGNVILRKGIQYLVEAARLLVDQPIDFQLAGPLGISERAVRTFPPSIKTLGRLTRDEVAHVYRRAHVFVLPTISDGFAITQLEAMAHGLPVITTPNCGQVVTDGLDGFIVPARDSQALADAIVRLNDDRVLLRAMSAEATKTILQYDLSSNARMIQNLVNQKRGL
jgi:glycosyltransferase involved in cell wall biosynthesis